MHGMVIAGDGIAGHSSSIVLTGTDTPPEHPRQRPTESVAVYRPSVQVAAGERVDFIDEATVFGETPVPDPLRECAAVALGLVAVHVLWASLLGGDGWKTAATLVAAPFYVIWKLTTLPGVVSASASFSDNEELFGSTFAEPEALLSPSGVAEGVTGGLIHLNQEALRKSSHPVPLSVYETNLSTLAGAITQEALN